MAFDFFNISGSLFVETTTDSKIRSSAQGLFMMMTNGFGAYLGSKVSGFMIDNYYTYDSQKDWPGTVSYTHLDVYKRQSVGFGLKMGKLKFNYSYSRYTLAANTSLFGLTINFADDE